MNLGQFRAEFRTRTLDLDPYEFNWSDDEINGYYNEAVNEAAERALMIFDDRTEIVCKIVLQAGVQRYPLHPSILSIQPGRVVLESRLDRPLHPFGFNDDWVECGMAPRQGKPTAYLDGEHFIDFFPTPSADDVAWMGVYRLPLAAMVADSDEPEGIHPRWHPRLHDWALRCAYRKQDSDTNNPGKAAQFEADFEQSFGAKRDANVTRKQRERRIVSVQPNDMGVYLGMGSGAAWPSRRSRW